MIGSRTVGVGILGLMLSTPAVQGQGGSLYREFQSGGDVASVAALTGMSAAEAKTVHQRPAVLENVSETQLDELGRQFDEGDQGEWDRITDSYGWSRAEAQAVWDWFSASPVEG